MKKIIFLLILLPISLQAQMLSICECLTEYDLEPYHTGSTTLDFENEEPLVVKAYFILEEITAIDRGFDESTYFEAVAYLNINYNQFNIFFKYIGFEFVDDIQDHDGNEYFPDRINFRIQNEPGGGAAGLFNPLNVILTYQAYNNEENKQYLLAHEVGHIFGLKHTNGNTSRFVDDFITPLVCNTEQIISGTFPSFDPTSNENVTRDETNINYNANIAGDFVVDTPATYFNPNLCIDTSSGISTLQYLFSNEVVDAIDIPYVDIDGTNFMISTPQGVIEFNEFITIFTEGQGVRMRETINNEPILQAILTTIACLYEPYSGDYYFAGPSNSDNKPLFQPGFDYKFVSAGGQIFNGYQFYNTPSDYEDTNFVYDVNTIANAVDRFSLDLESITHPNKSAIIIEQLDDQPRKCYHNINRGASSGKIIKFNDGVPNNNYTITDKDSLQINQPTLIQDLENGLYLIQKEYDDGTQEQNMILKGNNNE
ncbi:hypothetical protein [uncultured Dokdonia sp.]|uniref:hypothetical protein n=1 Tax=uncultured Dokdonia sp. TaxID=575653 RepID=UPI002623182B|nr:hypothetical protein [uncultured Dokdonia sp.]